MLAAKVVCAFSAVILLCSIAPHNSRLKEPGLVLWAWERPEDLRFIDPAKTGVAFLAATIGIEADGSIRFQPRLQPLRVPSQTESMAVVRIESAPHSVLPDPHAIVAPVRGVLEATHASGLQIDYDARGSERPFYRALLSALRESVNVPIGVTALASWCAGDSWLNDQPLAEAVPMYFRMGRSENRNLPIESAMCGSAIGLSTDEPWPLHPPQGLRHEPRIYVFNPQPWTRASYQAVRKAAEEWK